MPKNRSIAHAYFWPFSRYFTLLCWCTSELTQNAEFKSPLIANNPHYLLIHHTLTRPFSSSPVAEGIALPNHKCSFACHNACTICNVTPTFDLLHPSSFEKLWNSVQNQCQKSQMVSGPVSPVIYRQGSAEQRNHNFQQSSMNTN